MNPETRRLSRAEVRAASAQFKRTCGAVVAYPSGPEQAIRAHRTVKRTGRVAVAMTLAIIAVALLGGLVLAGCAGLTLGGSLQTTGKVLEVGGGVAASFPPLALIGSIVTVLGGAMGAIGAKLDKPIVRNIGFVAALAGAGGVGSEYQALTGSANDPKPGKSLVSPAEYEPSPATTTASQE